MTAPVASARGSLGPIYLDGELLDKVSVSDQDVTRIKLKEVVTLGPRGRAREALAYQGAGYPMIGVKHRLVLPFTNVATQYDLIEELLAVPGAHELVLWKRVHCAYAGDGDRTTFYLPWYVRDQFDDEIPVPGDLQAYEASGALGVEVRVGIDSTTLLVAYVKSAVDYAAGDPSAGQVWFLDQDLEFKVGTAPLAGERLYLRYVPILPMFEEPVTAKKYPTASPREPLDLSLVER